MKAQAENIIVVGGRRLHNELIGCRIACKTGLSCTFVDDGEDLCTGGNAQQLNGSLVLIDAFGMNEERLLSKVRALKNELPASCQLALHNLRKDSGIENEALELGVRGFFYEDDSADSLTKGIGNIIGGDVWISRKKMVECLLNCKPRSHSGADDQSPLTRREKEILSQLATGSTNDQIASRLCVSIHTVRTHIYHIFKKINVSNRIQASRWAEKHL